VGAIFLEDGENDVRVESIGCGPFQPDFS